MDMRFGTWNIRSIYRAGSLRIDQVKEDEMGRACSTNGEKRNAYRILVGKPERNRPPGRPRRIWVNNIKRDLRKTEWGRMAQDRDRWRALVNTVINLRFP
jgi:hypothetical protein